MAHFLMNLIMYSTKYDYVLFFSIYARHRRSSFFFGHCYFVFFCLFFYSLTHSMIEHLDSFVVPYKNKQWLTMEWIA